MKHLTLILLLTLAPLSWAYTFDDGTTFQDPPQTYSYFKCVQSYKEKIYQEQFLAISIQGKNSYRASTINKGWIKNENFYVTDNEIWIAEKELLNRTTLEIVHKDFRNMWDFPCVEATFDQAASWLTETRKERKI